MRRWIPVLTVLVAIVFATLAFPGSPVAAWLVGVLAGGDWRGLSESDDVNISTNSPDQPVLRAAVGAMITPERTYNDYREFFSLIAEKTHRRLELVQRKSYLEVNDLIADGAVDIAWVCTGAVANLGQRKAAHLLAVPVVGGRDDYLSYAIVRDQSPVSSIWDLRGTIMAFTDPLSLTGKKAVVDLLAGQAETPESFFRETFYSHAHDSSIRAVQSGLADAACVDSLVYDYLGKVSPEDIVGTRIIWRSELFPIPPLVSSAGIENDLFEEVQGVLLGLPDDDETSAVLENLKIDAFRQGDPRVYFPE